MWKTLLPYAFCLACSVAILAIVTVKFDRETSKHEITDKRLRNVEDHTLFIGDQQIKATERELKRTKEGR